MKNFIKKSLSSAIILISIISLISSQSNVSTKIIFKSSTPYRKNCQCIYLSGTQNQKWTKFNISSADYKRYNNSECVLIFITGTEQEIIEMRFEEIILRPKCLDQIHIFENLREPHIQETNQPEDTVCFENVYQFLLKNFETNSNKTLSNTKTFIHNSLGENKINNINVQYKNNIIEDTNLHKQFDRLQINGKNSPMNFNRGNEEFHIESSSSIFSSEKVLAMRLIYGHLNQNQPFEVIGKFKFIDKNLFKTDGNLVPSTFCDYEFLPHVPIKFVNYSKRIDFYQGFNINNESDVWRYFYSPRYPAKYPNHIKCSYMFIGGYGVSGVMPDWSCLLFMHAGLGHAECSCIVIIQVGHGDCSYMQRRFQNRVEVIFDDILLLTGHSSCLGHTDKIIIYDGKTPDKSSIVDVICNETPSRKIISSGPNFLIEFEASANRTSFGFSARYRFIDILFNKKNNYSENQPVDNKQTFVIPQKPKNKTNSFIIIGNNKNDFRNDITNNNINNTSNSRININIQNNNIKPTMSVTTKSATESTTTAKITLTTFLYKTVKGEVVKSNNNNNNYNNDNSNKNTTFTTNTTPITINIKVPMNIKPNVTTVLNTTSSIDVQNKTKTTSKLILENIEPLWPSGKVRFIKEKKEYRKNRRLKMENEINNGKMFEEFEKAGELKSGVDVNYLLHANPNWN
ncbi:uncharacterized protein LOC129612009 [Condylostylus longicornis]|uniref:uncharacterized protein LOC129612009 n=1 Tax=Condylostylus longicornis TaxID=2530218 RepID=UPI00244DF1FB|nr:uncharacterized protein LOC129612009 [Condylostylus longicornis]